MKKIKLLFVAITLIASYTLTAQVAITPDGSSAHASAMLDVKSTDKGFLPPRMTTIQRDAISSPADGLCIYNITTKCLEFYKAGAWAQICGGSGTPNAVYTIGSGGSCANTTLNGTYYTGIALDASHTVTMDATVTAAGGWSITTNTVNGYDFSGSGTFTGTGAQQVTLDGSGTPVANQTDNFTATADNSGGMCTFNVNVTILPQVTNPFTGRTWMDRNLGASQVATSSTDAAAYGDLYQWGRAIEGHEVRTSSNTSINATTATPNAGNIWDGMFITEPDMPKDWLAFQDNTLWQGVSGTNNPCPSGFRIPTEAELEAEQLSWETNNAAGAFGSVLKLTVGGYRNNSNGGFSFVGSYGYLWGSTVDGDQAIGLFFGPDGAMMGASVRAKGLSVRCIKD